MSEPHVVPSRTAIGLVATREVRERLRKRSFTVITVLIVLVLLAFGLAARVLGGGEPAAVEVGIAEPVPATASAALEQAGARTDRDVAVTRFEDAEAAVDATSDGTVDVAVLPDEDEVVFDQAVEDDVLAIVQQAWASLQLQQGLADVGLSEEQVAAALQTTPLEATTVGDDAEDEQVAELTGTFTAILLFIALQTFGTYVLMGVVEEKSTAVVEVLLVRARADQLLAGKVTGIGITALIQLTCAVAAGVVALLIAGVDVPGPVWSSLPMALVWFLLGYALYSTLFAVAGSLVSRQEDAQGAATPILTALIGAYLLVFVVGFQGESTTATVLSLLPPIAPLLMPVRMATGAAAPWEVVLALVLLVVTIGAAWKLAAAVYEQVLLRRGTRISWREAATLRGSRSG